MTLARATLYVEVPLRPYSLNAERAGSRFGRANRVSYYREAAKLATLSIVPRQRHALFECVAIDVYPWALNRRYRQDIGNCYPSAKACIDGIVDAGVIADDDDTHLVALTFHPHQFGRDALVLEVRAAERPVT